jgi:hypothetical protein
VGNMVPHPFDSIQEALHRGWLTCRGLAHGSSPLCLLQFALTLGEFSFVWKTQFRRIGPP